MRFPTTKTLIPTFFLQSGTAHSITRFSVNTVRVMSSVPTQHMFQLKLDPLTGNSEWVVIKDEEDEPPEDSPKPLLGTTSYLDMLNDFCRNRAFRQAIDKTITRPCHVLDIGAGTGLLSMMAVRAMDSGDSTVCFSSKGVVTACESYLPMVKLMRKVLRANGMQNKIQVINKRSDELEIGVDITSRADVLVSEILDSELLGEGLIPTLQHAHDKLLVENPQTVPFRATTYGQLVESTYLWKLHDLHNNEVKALDDIHLVPKGKEMILCTKQQQFAMHCDAMKDEIKLLSEPFKIFEFDFWRRPENQGETQLLVKATNDGTIHAVVSWWILQLDSEGTFLYTTGPKWNNYRIKGRESESSFPGPRNWCDHWKQCVWFVPGKGLSICKDEEVHLHAIHSKTSISYELRTQTQSMEVGCYDFNNQGCQLILPPERIAIYGDSNWRCSILKAIKSALQQKNSPLSVVADDSVFIAIAIVSLSKTSHLISMFPGLGEKGAEYLQAVAVANGYSMGRVEVVKKSKQPLAMCDTHQRKVDLLLGEPFYYGTDGLLPWQNLRFWKERTMLEPVLSEDAVIMPCKGILKACAMCLPDLWRSRFCLKDIEGFDHSGVNGTIGACGNLPAAEEGPPLPFFVWQCGQVKELSDIVTVMEFDFLKPISSCHGRVLIQFTGPGICHGFVFWIDWVLDTQNCIVLSTGPDQRYWKQGVKLLAEPVAVATHRSNVGESCSAEIEVCFEPSSGDLNIQHAFL